MSVSHTCVVLDTQKRETQRLSCGNVQRFSMRLKVVSRVEIMGLHNGPGVSCMR